jgi:hypothetical protein
MNHNHKYNYKNLFYHYRPAIIPSLLYSIYKIDNLSNNIYKDFTYNMTTFLGFDYILFLLSIGLTTSIKLQFHNNNFYLDLEIGEKS